MEEEATARLEEDEPSPVEWIKAPKALEEEAMARPEEAEPAVEGSDVAEHSLTSVEKKGYDEAGRR